jgi:hypothetical protein
MSYLVYLLLGAGAIAYVVWMTIDSYSNQLHYDMD